MTLKDNAVLNIGVGHFYLAPVGTAKPTDLGAPPVAWTEIGHTDLSNIFSMNTEGGDVTTLASLQSKSLRTSRTPTTETFTFNLLQFDEDSLKLYFGANAVSSGGWLDVPDEVVATQKAFLAVFTDGEEHFGLYAPKAEIQRADSVQFSDSTGFSGLPISVRPLNHEGAVSKYSVTPMATTP